MCKCASVAICLMMATQVHAEAEERQLQKLMAAVTALSRQIAELQQQLGAFAARPQFLHPSPNRPQAALPQTDVYSLASIIVNLRGEGARRLLKCNIHLKLSSPKIADTLNVPINAIRVRDSLITMLSGRSTEDIQDLAGKETLRTGIRDHLNGLLKLDRGIEEVLFTEFMIQ